ncbi:hypothetical protein [Pseudomonas umsongensis]|uniref:Uncharacterized protein n=1 Tax=Pseudomonas umsongensis TaxID=198618 RepID=A0AAE6ZV98_9PSED|nr:hypothetical protein [Pseudomonas umsongensis]QJC78964.1 hypothetical protein HGP31_11805 [Pseudomonas umsongensis]
MTVRKLDTDGDLAMGPQEFLTGYSAEEVAQNVLTRLKFFLGEWFLDTADGTDWFGSVLGKGSALASRESVIRRRILLTPGCAGMTAFSMTTDIATRQLTVSASIVSSSGDSAEINYVQAVI